MAWVAADRAVKAVEQFGLDGPLPRWQQLREEICRDILTKGTTSSDTRSPSTTGRASWTRRC